MERLELTSGGTRRWATLQEAATYVSCHPKTIMRRFSDGTLSRYRIGRKVLVDLDELDAVLVEHSYIAPSSRQR